MAVLSIRLYGQDEECREYSRGYVPWKMLKGAMRMAKKLNGAQIAELDESTFAELGQLVVDVFGGQFTLAELEDGASVPEVMAVLQQIVSIAGSSNPTRPS